MIRRLEFWRSFFAPSYTIRPSRGPEAYPTREAALLADPNLLLVAVFGQLSFEEACQTSIRAQTQTHYRFLGPQSSHIPTTSITLY